MTAFAAAELFTPAPTLRTVLECGIAVVTWGASASWVRANRVAFDRLEWCGCAPSTVTVRVIVSRPPHPPRLPADAGAAAPSHSVLAGATLQM
jgi:hypothetical protein